MKNKNTGSLKSELSREQLKKAVDARKIQSLHQEDSVDDSTGTGTSGSTDQTKQPIPNVDQPTGMVLMPEDTGMGARFAKLVESKRLEAAVLSATKKEEKGEAEEQQKLENLPLASPKVDDKKIQQAPKKQEPNLTFTSTKTKTEKQAEKIEKPLPVVTPEEKKKKVMEGQLEVEAMDNLPAVKRVISDRTVVVVKKNEGAVVQGEMARKTIQKGEEARRDEVTGKKGKEGDAVQMVVAVEPYKQKTVTEKVQKIAVADKGLVETSLVDKETKMAEGNIVEGLVEEYAVVKEALLVKAAAEAAHAMPLDANSAGVSSQFVADMPAKEDKQQAHGEMPVEKAEVSLGTEDPTKGKVKSSEVTATASAKMEKKKMTEELDEEAEKQELQEAQEKIVEVTAGGGSVAVSNDAAKATKAAVSPQQVGAGGTTSSGQFDTRDALQSISRWLTTESGLKIINMIRKQEEEEEKARAEKEAAFRAGGKDAVVLPEAWEDDENVQNTIKKVGILMSDVIKKIEKSDEEGEEDDDDASLKVENKPR